MEITLEELQSSLKRETELLNLFRKYSMAEKGFVLGMSLELLPELQNLPKLEELIRRELPEYESYPVQKKLSVVRYISLLVAVLRHERNLRRMEYWEGDFLRAKLLDERALNVARAIKKELTRKRAPKRERLERLKGEILSLHRQGYGTKVIAEYLKRAHRLRVTRQYLWQCLKKWEQESTEQAQRT